MKLDFDKTGGLVPAIIQDAETGKVLMLAYMNSIAWEKTLKPGKPGSTAGRATNNG